MLKITLTFAALFMTLSTTLAKADEIAGDYRKDDQHDVFITKLSDKPNVYFVTMLLVDGDQKACFFEQEMKLASGGLVYAAINCGVGITKDSPKSIKVVGSCPQACQNGMSIAIDGVPKVSETEPISSADLLKGD